MVRIILDLNIKYDTNGCQGSKSLRKNVNDLSSQERQELNLALGNMKALDVSDPTDWRSYGKIASYHGAPFMCDEEW